MSIPIQPKSPLLIRTRAASAPARAAAPMTSSASTARRVVKPTVVTRAAPTEDSVWFRIKRSIMNVLCNVPLPSFTARTAPQAAPADLKAQLKPGDVLLRRTEGTSGNLFIPSWWKHAAVYTGDGYVVEATFNGVKKTPIDQFFAEGDHAMVVRAKGVTPEKQAQAAAYAEAQIGKPYDFDVDFDDDSRVTCTELADQAVNAAEGRTLVKRGMLNAVVGDAFMNNNFELLYTSSPERSKF
ncbi:hypothetical protein D3C72_459840 [compost metagenome]